MPLLAAACIASATLVLADPTSDARKAIQAQYDRANAAAAKKDIKGNIAIFTSDRISVDEKGTTLTLAQYRKLNSALFSSAASISASSTIENISAKGDTATVRVKEHGKLVIINPQTKQASTLVIDSVSDDIWVKRSGMWLQKRSVEKSANTVLDGQHVDR